MALTFPADYHNRNVIVVNKVFFFYILEEISWPLFP